MYIENYETLLKEIKENLSKWEGTHVYRLWDLLITQQYSPNWSTDSIPIKIPVGLFEEIDGLILKFIWKYKKPRLAKKILKNIKLEDSHLQLKNLVQSLQ